MKTIIVDIDGTLADCSHRRHFVEKKPKDWKNFCRPDLVMRDKPIMPIVELVRSMAESGYWVIVVTGRHKEHEDITKQWLRKHGIPFAGFYCRQNGDFRQDWEVKSEILDQILAKGHQVAFTVDDRNQVVEMWRRRGLICLQAAEGDF